MSFTAHGAVSVSNTDALVGVMDLDVVQTSSGTYLFAATRGDGWLTVFDLGANGGDTAQADSWAISSSYLQLESTDIEIRQTSGTGFELFLAGLNSDSLQGVSVTAGNGANTFGSDLSRSASGLDAGDITEMALWEDGTGGLVALRGGGLSHVTFGSGTQMHIQAVSQGSAMNGRSATDIVTATHGGQTVALVTYGADNTVSLFRMAGNGTVQHMADLGVEDGMWAERPGAMTTTVGADGGLYVVVTASGSGSLSVLSIDADGTGMSVVDHVLDTLDTRFDDASYVSTVTINGQDYVVAAGTDSGLSLFVVLNGGRLQHIEAIAGSVGSPLNNISNIEAAETANGARLFVTTQSAPYLVEYTITHDAPGETRVAEQGGGTLGGTGGDDILNGGNGADWLQGGAGDDILIDGAGSDTLQGGQGADLFVLTQDEATDVILDYQPGQDRIDISALGVVGGVENLIISSRSWGAELRYGTSVIEVRSADGSSLSAADFAGDAIIVGNRPPTDLSVYEEAEPETDPVHPATQTAGPQPAAPIWMAEPTFAMPDVAGAAQGGAGPEQTNGTDGHDVIFGNAGDDTIVGDFGNDSLSGDGGADLINAGAGDDLVFGGIGFDTMDGRVGEDTLIGGENADSIYGGSGNDILIGGAGFDQLFGEDGNDSMWSGDTADRLYGGAGDDWMSAGINFGLTVDGLWGEEGNDTMFGNAGFDLLDGGDGNDLMDGGDQADNLYGRTGNDTIFGGQGLDRLFGGAGDDQLVGGSGNDGHFGEQGNDTAWGGSGNDRFFGGAGNDILMGESGDDSLFGGAGFDTLVGGTGDDLMAGDFNADRFVFETDHGNDTIRDFDANNAFELMDFSNLSAFDTVNSVLAVSQQVGSDVLITTGSNSSIRLLDVNLADLGVDDFVF
ncbi:calcium-binding protein [uncultured Tateyamaria sp.]|uniref:calcium-binding protein n=1 Tax=uncultured Tateyamaria sp. TaxID=455651 RepID=UPI00260CB5E7|nr:calcium-binding protein [uncultured Tateyamaria sp.]